MELLYIFFGWLLGLLSPQLNERINRHYKKQDFTIGLLSEFKELKARLIANVYLLIKKIGTCKKEQLEWLVNNIDEYEGSYPPQGIKQNLTKLIEQANTDQIETIGLIDEYASESRGLDLKKFFLPFLEAKIDSLSLLDEKFRIQVFEIRSKIIIINEEIDNARFFFRKTFDSSLDELNQKIIKINLESSYSHIVDQAMSTVEKISNLLSSTVNKKIIK